MNIFVSTQFCLPRITESEIKKAMGDPDEILGLKLQINKTKKKTLDYRGQNPSFQEVRLKTGEVKFIALDCKVKTDRKHKIFCWGQCGRNGYEENGMPVSMRDKMEDETLVTEVGRYGYFCNCRCMYRVVMERARGSHSEAVEYGKIALNAEILYRICHPDKGAIVPAKDWEMLRCNGGTVDYDVWEDEELKLERIPGFVYTQAHQSYSS